MGTSVNSPAQLRSCHAIRASPFNLENCHASLIQRDCHQNNGLIKSDAVPVEPGKTAPQVAQKDIVARWTMRGGQLDEIRWMIASENLDRRKGGVAEKDRQPELT